jgi:hypothetical protein
MLRLLVSARSILAPPATGPHHPGLNGSTTIVFRAARSSSCAWRA